MVSEPEAVAEIFIEMLDAGTYPSNEENVRRIVQNLYSRGCKKKADIICNRYGEEGYYFLKDIFENRSPIDIASAAPEGG
jgi:hypothetical protein